MASFVDITERLLDANLVQGTNTTIGVVATNGTLTSAEVNRVAEMAHDGMARAIRRLIRCLMVIRFFRSLLGTYRQQREYRRILAAEVVAAAIVNAVTV